MSDFPVTTQPGSGDGPVDMGADLKAIELNEELPEEEKKKKKDRTDAGTSNGDVIYDGGDAELACLAGCCWCFNSPSHSSSGVGGDDDGCCDCDCCDGDGCDCGDCDCDCGDCSFDCC